MYIDIINNKNNKPETLLKRCFKDNGVEKIETVANLSSLDSKVIENISKALTDVDSTTAKGIENSIEVESSTSCGHVDAVLTAMKKLDIANLLDPTPGPERELVMGLLAAAIIFPAGRPDDVSPWDLTTLPTELGLSGPSEADVDAALDWLADRQAEIEKKLFGRHHDLGELLFVGLLPLRRESRTPSSENEAAPRETGHPHASNHRPWSGLGHGGEKEGGRLRINLPLTTDRKGIPLSISLFPAGISDMEALTQAAENMRQDHEPSTPVMVADAGLINSEVITELKEEGLDWIAALNQRDVNRLIRKNVISLDEVKDHHCLELGDLAEYPGERLAVWRDPSLRSKQINSRNWRIEAVKQDLDMISTKIRNGTLSDIVDILREAGTAIGRLKMDKHIIFSAGHASLDYEFKKDTLENEARADGLSVIRTSLPADRISAKECLERYQILAKTQNYFKPMRAMDLGKKHIRHLSKTQIISFFFLAMLSYYVEYHLREAWKPILMGGAGPEHKPAGHPAPPARGPKKTGKKAGGQPPQECPTPKSFKMVLKDLSGIHDIGFWFEPSPGKKIFFRKKTKFTPFQANAFALLENIKTIP